MSDQATIFELPYNLFLMQRMEFVVACGDHLAANVMRVMESEMIKRKEAWQVRVEKALEAKKTPPPAPKAYWVCLSQAQIISRLYMYDSAKLKKPESEDLASPEWVEYRFKRALSISKATLKKAIELLKALGFLIERSKPGDEFGAPIYTLNKDNVQKAIKALPANPFAIFHHLGGVENIDSGGESKNFNVPPKNSDSGESKKSDVPLEEIETGESKNFRVDIDITIDPPEDSEIDNYEEEDTLPRNSAPPSSGAAIALPAPTQSSQDEEPYQPDFTANEDRTSQSVRTPESTPQAASPTPELSTLSVSSPQASAKVEPRRSRTPTAPKVDQAEVEVYLAVFDELYREVTGDPETGYGHTGVDRKAITDDLLKPKLINPKFVTPEKLRAVYRHLFKKPKDETTGFCWADNMSIKAVCRNYATEAMALTTQAQQAKAQKAATKTKEPTAIELLRAQQQRYAPTGGVAHV